MSKKGCERLSVRLTATPRMRVLLADVITSKPAIKTISYEDFRFHHIDDFSEKAHPNSRVYQPTFHQKY